jgi:hypothetical protein
MGAHLLSLLTGIMGVFKLPLAAVASWRFPVLEELRQDSGFLKDLRVDTQTALQAGDAEFLRARVVAICERDDVVDPRVFCAHDAAPIVLSRDHVAICKPSADYMTPVELVAGVLAHDP